MKKIKIIGIGMLLACLPFSMVAQQALSVRQLLQMGLAIAEDAEEFRTLADQGVNIMKRTELSFKRLKLIEKMNNEIERLIKGEGFKRYEENFGAEEDIRQQVEMFRLRIASLGGLAFTIAGIVTDFGKDVVKAGAAAAKDRVAMLTDIGTKASVAAATAGVSTLIDLVPITNAVTMMKAKMTKDNIKTFLVEIINMLNRMNLQMDALYDAMKKVHSTLKEFNDAGALAEGPKMYAYAAGQYKMQKGQDKKDAEMKRKQKEVEERLSKIKDEALKNKLIRVYKIVIN